ncbi:MAG: hypothetical protein JWR87_2513 [Segetibacter sp.]|nr:hypothetical protein [Segetibacter sp.]
MTAGTKNQNINVSAYLKVIQSFSKARNRIYIRVSMAIAVTQLMIIAFLKLNWTLKYCNDFLRITAAIDPATAEIAAIKREKIATEYATEKPFANKMVFLSPFGIMLQIVTEDRMMAYIITIKEYANTAATAAIAPLYAIVLSEIISLLFSMFIVFLPFA